MDEKTSKGNFVLFKIDNSGVSFMDDSPLIGHLVAENLNVKALFNELKDRKMTINLRSLYDKTKKDFFELKTGNRRFAVVKHGKVSLRNIDNKVLNNEVKNTSHRINNKIVKNKVISYPVEHILNITLDNITSFMKFIHNKLTEYGSEKHKNHYYSIKLFYDETDPNNNKSSFIISTPYGNINNTLNDIYKKLIDFFRTYDVEYSVEISKIIISSYKVPRITERLIYGIKEPKFLETFLKDKIKFSNNNLKRHNYIKKFKDNNLDKYKEFIENNHIIFPDTNKHCLILAFFISFYRQHNKPIINKCNNFIKTYDNKEENRTIDYVFKHLSKEFKCNIEFIDLTTMNKEEIIYQKNMKKKPVRIALYGAHAYGVITKGAIKEYYNEINLKVICQKLIKVKKENKEDNKNNYKIYTYDFEATGDKSNKTTMKPYAVGIYNGKKYKSFFSSDYDDILKEFINYLYKECDDKIIIYGHNGGKFDIYLLINKLIEHKYIIIQNLLDKNGRIINLITKYKNKTIIFRDTYCFINSSLEAACKDFKTKTKKKVDDVDHDLININNCDTKRVKEEVYEYLKNDCVSLFEVIESFNKVLNDNFDIDIREVLTNAAISRKVYSKYYNSEETPIYTFDEDKYHKFVDYYLGGRNECLRRLGEIIKKLYYYDFTSLYPYVMYKYSYPYGIMQSIVTNKFDKEKFGFYKVNVNHTKEAIKNKELPFLGIFKENKLIFPYFETPQEIILTSEEIKYIKEHKLGYEIQIKKFYYYEKHGKIFHYIVEKLYKLKQHAEKNDLEVLRNTVKIIINSLYGFWGTKLFREQISITKNKSECKNIADLLNYLASGNLIDHKEINNYNIFKYKDTIEPEFANIGLAMYITSYSRMELYTLMTNIQKKGGKVYYCDTDSVICDYCIEEDKELYKKYMTGGGDVLGNLKNEIIKFKKKNEIKSKDLFFDSAVIVGCKVYAIKKEKAYDVKMKGLNTKNKYKLYDVDNKINKQIIFKGLSKEGKYKIDYDALKLISEGYTLIADNMSILASSNILLGNDSVKKIKNIKNIKMQYTKAKLKNNNISPLILSEKNEDDESSSDSDEDADTESSDSE